MNLPDLQTLAPYLQQLSFGLLAGFAAGYALKKVGKFVAIALGLLDGELIVGLADTELERLATKPADKASLWNLAGLAASGRSAGTTVAATLHAANQAGVQVFATGGIGGVHPAPFDESADLSALARNRVITVCSGPKSVLDAGATLERLETLGV
ncbi:MAG TPA: pseudouridine-5'-phosphate glycosidase, partial [Trueperaceae bacterium]